MKFAGEKLKILRNIQKVNIYVSLNSILVLLQNCFDFIYGPYTKTFIKILNKNKEGNGSYNNLINDNNCMSIVNSKRTLDLMFISANHFSNPTNIKTWILSLQWLILQKNKDFAAKNILSVHFLKS